MRARVAASSSGWVYRDANTQWLAACSRAAAADQAGSRSLGQARAGRSPLGVLFTALFARNNTPNRYGLPGCRTCRIYGRGSGVVAARPRPEPVQPGRSTSRTPCPLTEGAGVQAGTPEKDVRIPSVGRVRRSWCRGGRGRRWPSCCGPATPDQTQPDTKITKHQGYTIEQ